MSLFDDDSNPHPRPGDNPTSGDRSVADRTLHLGTTPAAAATDSAGGGDLAPADEDPRLFAAVQEYVTAVEAGRRPDRRALLARHPDIADELSACLQGLAFVNSAVARLDAADATGFTPADHPAPEELSSGRPLGDFRLVREIGRGGMGVVYEAEQLSLGRRVALKVLPLAAALDPRHLQRFRNEAQAAAHLHHTNIVPVHAVGCERSVHFYAMQLIDGQSLAEVIRGLRDAAAAAPPTTGGRRSRRSAGTPGRRDAGTPGRSGPSAPTLAASAPPVLKAFLRQDERAAVGSRAGTAGSPSAADDDASADVPDSLSALRAVKRSAFHRAVARLGLQAAEALDYAHQQGVVHRDVKPANLMLDLRGTLWVTDFGLAQMYADTGLTQPGDLLGTLRYMSPEQAAGRAVVLDHRTDVYSLGVTLYEFLTLERAYPSELREPLLYEIANVDPRPARAIDKTIPAELETIIAKAMAKAPADRYPTARAMADDLRRFLAEEPIHARPPTLWDKAVKWTRRHKTLARAAVAMLAVVAAGTTVSTLLIAREQARTADARERAEQAYTVERYRAADAERQRGEADLQRAEAERQKARAERSGRKAREAVAFFARFATEEMPLDFQLVRQRRRMVEAAVRYYQSFVEDHQNDPAATAELAAAKAWATDALSELAAVDELARAEVAARLLALRDVQADLGLSTDQSASAASAGRRRPGGGPGSTDGPGETGTDDERPDLRAMTPQERHDLLMRNAATAWRAIEGVLSPGQADRLRQISRQVRGVAALLDPDVSATLMLTAEQAEAVYQAQASSANRPPGPGGPGGSHGPGGPGGPGGLGGGLGVRRGSRSDGTTTSVTTADILTADQRLVWAALVGRAYAGAVPRDVGGPGSRGRPGGGGPPGIGGPRGPGGDLPPPDGRFGPPDGPPDGNRPGHGRQ